MADRTAKVGAFLILAKTWSPAAWIMPAAWGYGTGQNQRQISNELLGTNTETVLEKFDFKIYISNWIGVGGSHYYYCSFRGPNFASPTPPQYSNLPMYALEVLLHTPSESCEKDECRVTNLTFFLFDNTKLGWRSLTYGETLYVDTFYSVRSKIFFSFWERVISSGDGFTITKFGTMAAEPLVTSQKKGSIFVWNSVKSGEELGT